jgi:non-lysosomal glucosylceramidase
MADIAGLGPLLDEAHIRTTLDSIYKYNYRAGMNDAPSVERAFSVNGESALVMCDYGKSERPEIPFPYYSENFTGSEYAVAILMLRYGMVKEGVQCIANIRARYDGEKANPYNEAEYGRHYARAMASWGSIPILSGFLYNGVTRELEIKPLIHRPEFRCFWSTPGAWGGFELNSKHGDSTFRLQPSKGSIEIRRFRFSKETFPSGNLKILLGDESLPCQAQFHGKDILIECKQNVRVTPARPFVVSAN